MKKLFLLTIISLLAVSGISAQHIAVLNDIHVTPGNANERQLRLAVDEINAADYDAVIVNGDLGNEGSVVELENVKSIIDSIRHPLHVLPGNHESTWSRSATKAFFDLWGNDRFVTRIDSLVIVGINCGPYMKMGDGHIKQEDLHWLKATLNTAVTPGRRVLSFNHYPLLADLDNYTDYITLLEQYPVIGHINGHYHRWRAYNAGGAPDSGIPCVMTRALDMGKGDYGYTVIDIDNDWVHVYNKPIGRDPEAKFAFANTVNHPKAVLPARPELKVPDGFKVDKVWADSASVFTRLEFDKDNV